MIDQNLLGQLKSVFEPLDQKVSLAYYHSDHTKQDELLSMLKQVVETNSFLELVELDQSSDFPRFEIHHAHKNSGIAFTGVPGGHEFSSLVLAILNVNGKGKLPEKEIIERIKGLKSGIDLKTVVSLSCQNCPGAVQALNLMASLNEGLTHEMIDGEYIQDQLAQWGVRGVPSVLDGEKLVHSGKTNLEEILGKLEKSYQN